MRNPIWTWSGRAQVIFLAVIVVGVLYVFGGLDTLLVKSGVHANMYYCFQETSPSNVVVCCGPLASGHSTSVCDGR